MIAILMGVTGSGKTTIGRLLATRLGWQFEDADWYHPAANIKKMSSGTALTDEDRQPWLDHLADMISQSITEEKNVILACSALKKSYRRTLRVDPSKVVFVYLKVDQESLARRLENRHDHFMDRHLLTSQFETLEEPTNAITIDANQSPEECVEAILQLLPLHDVT